MFTTTMRFVGDLDDEFYDDERQRDVWNEASAVGFQMFVWASLIAAAVLPWMAGRAGSWFALGVLVVYLAVAFAVLAYSKSRGLDMYTQQHNLRRPRTVLATLLYLIGAAGAVFTLIAPDFPVGTAAGGAVGGAVGFAAAAIGLRRKKRLDRDEEVRAEQAELLELQKEG